MSDGMVYAERTDRRRAILLGAMTPTYYNIVSDDERAQVIAGFRKLVEDWQALGARVVATLDDDLFMVGDPGVKGFTFYLMFDVDDPQIVIDMIQRIREPADGLRMDRYVRFEARVGRPFFLLEEAQEVSDSLGRRGPIAS